MNVSPPSRPEFDGAAMRSTLLRLPDRAPLQWLQHQERHSPLQAPGWLQLARALHTLRGEGGAPQPMADHLLSPMGRFGQWCEGWTQTDEEGIEQPVLWYGDLPSVHLQRVGASALLALGISEGLTRPDLGEPHTGYQRSTALALRWLEAAALRLCQHPPPVMAWGLPETVERVVGLGEARVRVLFRVRDGKGALGDLRLVAVREPGAHLTLAPMPTSLCLLLDADFGQALETVTQYLRKTLVQTKAGSALPPTADIALAWDLAPAAGETAVSGFASLYGDSAGAAFACAALQALAPYAPATLRGHLQRAAPLLPNAFISAAIDVSGRLRPVGGLGDKAQGFGPLAQALARCTGRVDMSTLYLSAEQTGVDPMDGITLLPLHSVADILSDLAQRAAPLSADQETFLSEGFADPEQLTLALNDAARQEETEKLLNRLVDDVHANPVRSVSQAAIQGVARWVRQAGGRLRHQFVPLRVQPESTEAKRLPAAARDHFDRLPELLHLADDSAHRSYLLTGLPGAGKSVLLRRHMLECCEQLLRPAVGGAPDGPALAELPIYLPMDAFDLPDPPDDQPAAPWWAERARQFTRATLTQYGWTPAMVEALLHPSSNTIALPPARFQLDALNELPLPKSAAYARSKRAEWVVQGFLDAFSPRARKPLLSVRSHHFNVPDALPVEVMPWNKDRIREYLTRYFGEQRAAQLWLQFNDDKALLELCSRPMHMHMQCELIEGGYAPLATDRASLYLAHLWLRLRRALGLFGERDTRQKPNKVLDNDFELLTQRDRDQIEQTKPGHIDADDLRDLPTHGFLLRGLMQQAEHQYWADTESGKDSRERCSVSVRIKDIHLKEPNGDPVSSDLIDRWINACAALDLLEKDGANRVKFSHQSWGEFFASLRLLDTPPDELERQVKAGLPGAQDKWSRAKQRPFAHLLEPVSAEAERQALRDRVNQRWAPVLPRLQRFLAHNQGRLAVDMATFKADRSVNMPEADDAQVVQRYTANGWIGAGLLEFPDGQGTVLAHLDQWVDRLGIASAVGLAPGASWATDAAASQALLVTRLYACFENQVWAHLRQGDESGPGLSDEAEQLLLQEPGHMALPATSDVQEVLQLALQGLTQKQAEAWLAHWLTNPPQPQAWRVLVPAALALRARLEPPLDDSGRIASQGQWRFPKRPEKQPHPLLQHLRRWLLLASVDAGEPARERVQAAGVWAALQAPISGLPAAIEAAWAAQRAAAFTSDGLDLLLRLQAGLLLGELGDNIRYERWAEVVEGRERVGIRLKAAHWALVPASGPQATHRIGATHWDNSQPIWPVPEGKLPAMRFAHSPAVVMQWQAYVEDLRARGERAPALWAMDQSRWSNPLQPITTLDWFTAQRFTAWMAPLHADMFPELDGDGEDKIAQLALPTEVQHEAAVRFDSEHPHPEWQAKWPHDASDKREPDQMPPDLFNHNRTRWGAPAPVGVFSAALTPTGIEAMGNVWTWCANVNTDDYQGDNARLANRPYTATTPEEWQERAQANDQNNLDLLALRGGSFSGAADLALAAYRGRLRPGVDDYYFGLRWLMCRPIVEP